MQEAPVLALVAALFALPVLAGPGSAERAGEIFCTAQGDLDIGARAPYLSPGLARAIAVAQAASDRFAAENPGDKPPLGDGIPWQSWPDHAQNCIPGEPLYGMDEASLDIAYGFPESPGADYADRLHLVLIDGYWLIDDVSYASGAPSLRDRLEEIAFDAKK